MADEGARHRAGPGTPTAREVRTILAREAFQPVFQPIFEMESRTIVAYEALARFESASPTDVFAAAAAAGLRGELEQATLQAAFAAAGSLPAAALLHVNVSVDVILQHQLLANLLARHGWLVVLELTEEVAVSDYGAFRAGIEALGPDVMLAVDDAGAGFASFRHILELKPQFVKLDGSIVRGIATNPAKQALVAGLSYFAIRTGCVLIAESIESASSVRTLLDLGVSLGQGYYLARPVRIGDLERARERPIDWPARGPQSRPEQVSAMDREMPVEKVLNIGHTLAQALEEIGIHTFGELSDTGAVTAWRQIRAVRPKAATAGTLVALEASIQAVRPSMLSPKQRGLLGVIARVEGRRSRQTPE
jgi:EAL domain-containing protein (putative c-di-GMP-specific phosphodiesterase class I)